MTPVLIFKVMASTCQSNAIYSSLVLLIRGRNCLCGTFGNSVCGSVYLNCSWSFLSTIFRWNMTAAFSSCFNASFPLHLTERNPLNCEMWKDTCLGSEKVSSGNPIIFLGSRLRRCYGKFRWTQGSPEVWQESQKTWHKIIILFKCNV